MNRRSFLKSILATGVAPYVVTTAGLLMPVKQLWTPPEKQLLVVNTVVVEDPAFYAVGDVVKVDSRDFQEYARVIAVDGFNISVIRSAAYHK